MNAFGHKYDWALNQLHIEEAHRTTRGSERIVVAVIDLGYRHHPDLDGHLWRNSHPSKDDIHGWDFVDNDASLEYTGPAEDASEYYRGHHVFVAGEVAAVAPECPIMIVRVGYSNPRSWEQGIRYAVDQRASVLVIPHSYIPYAETSATPLFFQGTDFAYPEDNPALRLALDYAYDQGCLIFSGTADNRGRRVAFAGSGFEAVCAVGSANRNDEPADICCSADYVEIGAPGGQRDSDDEIDRIWGCGGDMNDIQFTGGCMASGFAGGVAALVWSRFPHLSNEQIRQILRNTARCANGVSTDSRGWESRLGYGILDAAKAVSIDADQLCRDVRTVEASASVRRQGGNYFLEARLHNRGIYDAEKAVVVAYNGDPTMPVDCLGTVDNPAAALQTMQIGHSIIRVRGLHEATVSIALTEKPGNSLWLETYCSDRHDAGIVHRRHIDLTEGKLE